MRRIALYLVELAFQSFSMAVMAMATDAVPIHDFFAFILKTFRVETSNLMSCSCLAFALVNLIDWMSWLEL